MNEKNCRLVKLVKKDSEWIIFKISETKQIRILTKDDPSGSRKKTKVIIDCPKDIKIKSEQLEENDNIGNC